MAFVNLMDIVYPVGSLYFTTTSVSPSSTIGGTWVQFESHASVMQGGSTANIGTFQGDRTIPIDCMPMHRHGERVAVSGDSYSDTITPWSMYIGDRWANTGAIRANDGSSKKGSFGLTSFGDTDYVGNSKEYVPYSLMCNIYYRTA